MKTTSVQATILGLTSKEMVSRLENEFSKRELTVHFGEPTRWPIWIFNHDLQLFSTRLEGLSRLSEIMSGISEDDWNDCPHRMIPLSWQQASTFHRIIRNILRSGKIGIVIASLNKPRHKG